MPLLLIKIGLGILSGVKSIGKFFMANWKIILPLLLVGAAIWYHNKAVDESYKSGYSQGTTDEKAAEQARVDEENRRNRQFEQMLQNAINEFGRGLVEDTAERVAVETKLRTSVQTIIRDNPIYEQCKVDPEVIDARNQIRALGPPENPIRVELPNEE